MGMFLSQSRFSQPLKKAIRRAKAVTQTSRRIIVFSTKPNIKRTKPTPPKMKAKGSNGLIVVKAGKGVNSNHGKENWKHM